MVWALASQLPNFDARSSIAIERGFALAVRDRLHGGILRHSDRAALLRAARRLSIESFRANLIIALVQREVGNGKSDPILRMPRRKRSLIPIVATLLVIEAIAGAALWRIWIG